METKPTEIQRTRIVTLVGELDPSLEVEFHKKRLSPLSTDIRFRLRDKFSGTIVASIEADGEWGLTNLQDTSDAKLRTMIALLVKSGRDQPI
jgi:hypothetical protein